MYINNKTANPYFVLIAILLACVLYSLRLSPSIQAPGVETVVYIFVSLLAALLGVFVAMRGKSFPCRQCNGIAATRKGIYLLWILYLLSVILYLYEHYIFYKTYGTIPIGLIDFEVKRMEFAINGYIHLVAIMGYIFLYLIIFDIIYSLKTYSMLYRMMVAFFVILYIALSFAVGNRGDIFSFICYTLIMMLFRYKISNILLISGSTLLIYSLGVAKLLRDHIFFGESVFNHLEENWLFGDNIIAAPLYYSYMTFVMNFEMLNKYVQAEFEPMLGYLTLYSPIASVFPVKILELKDLQHKILGIDFYGTLTATGLGVLFIDYWAFAPFFLMILFFLLGQINKNIFKKSQYFLIPLYSYFYFNMFLLIYTYPFNKFYILFYSFFILFFTKSFFKNNPKQT